MACRPFCQSVACCHRCRWVHEQPEGVPPEAVEKLVAGSTIQRHLLARAALVLFDSDAQRGWWERWVLDEAWWVGLDFSPPIGRQYSFQPDPPLPTSLPWLRTRARGVQGSAEQPTDPPAFYTTLEADIRGVAAGAGVADAAARGPEAPPVEGLPLVEGAARPSGWADAFMPDPRSRARVEVDEMR